jgi:SAM-dependent methyltransferase
MNIFCREYYDQDVFWDNDYGSDEGNLERLRIVAETVPVDVRSVLDVGCANGKALQAIARLRGSEEMEVLAGIDLSKRALRKFDLDRVCGDCSRLPFADSSFDVVLCLQVLEHLPQRMYERTLKELQRVSRRYLLISVPNDEDIRGSAVVCPKCYCWFNSSFHVRSFRAGMLKRLFQPCFTANTIKAIGPPRISYRLPQFVWELSRFILKPSPPATAICPQCGYRKNSIWSPPIDVIPEKKEALTATTSLLREVIRLTWPKTTRGRWLLGLYEKM